MIMKKKLTVVCCYNDKKQYSRLVKTLSEQTVSCELIGIDNCSNTFPSAASALNSAAGKIQTEYVVYSHQDIRLQKPDLLQTFLTYVCQIQTGDILGVAGAVKNPDRHSSDLEFVASKILHGPGHASAGEIDYSGMIPCETVDECFFGGKTETFVKAPFDEKLCPGWHLYAVDRCLFAHSFGRSVYVCDLPLVHESGGKIDHSYNLNFYRIAKHYAQLNSNSQKKSDVPQRKSSRIRCIRTVCGSAKTDFIHRSYFYLKRELLFFLHRL